MTKKELENFLRHSTGMTNEEINDIVSRASDIYFNEKGFVEYTLTPKD